MNDLLSKQTASTRHKSDSGDPSFDLVGYIDLIFDQWRLIGAITAIAIFFGTCYAILSRPIFEANILVQVEDSASSSGNIMGDLAGAFSLKSAATAEIEILRSRLVVRRTVENTRLDLTIEPRYFPVIGRWISRHQTDLSEPGLFGFGGYAWGQERARIGIFEIPQVLKGEEFVLTAEKNGTYSLNHAKHDISITGKVGIAAEKNTAYGKIKVRVDEIRGNPGTRFYVKREPVLDTTEDLQLSLAIAEKGKQSGIIGVSLQGTDPEKTASTLNEIGHQYIRQNIERKSLEAEKSLEFLENQLPQMKTNLEAVESKYNALRNNRGTVDLAEEAKSILQQSVLSQTRLVELRQKRDELTIRYQVSHPVIQAIDKQIKTLNYEISTVDKKIRAMPSIEQDVLRLTRDVKVTTDLYTSLLNSAQQLRLLKASKVGNARLLDSAVTPLHPVRPKRLFILGFATVLGLLAGIIFALTRKTLFGGVEDPHEIEEALGFTVSAAIPFSEKQAILYAQVNTNKDRNLVLAAEDPSDNAIESLRSFRTTLQFAMLSAKNRVVMITGPTPGVGKSFVSTNLAAVLGANGKRVLLIDADLRRGYLNKYFGLERKDGLAELINGKITIAEATRKNLLQNVDFIPTGALPLNPAELLSQKNFPEVLKNLEVNYDIVIIDTAPILAVTDAMIVAPYAGAIFNVVRGNVSTIGEIEETAKRLDSAGTSVAGVVFNGLKIRFTRNGYGSKYGKYRYAQYKY